MDEGRVGGGLVLVEFELPLGGGVVEGAGGDAAGGALVERGVGVRGRVFEDADVVGVGAEGAALDDADGRIDDELAAGGREGHCGGVLGVVAQGAGLGRIRPVRKADAAYGAAQAKSVGTG